MIPSYCEPDRLPFKVQIADKDYGETPEQWCTDNIDIRDWDYHFILDKNLGGLDVYWAYSFKSEQDAIMFALNWA